jgi:hypothetical protein
MATSFRSLADPVVIKKIAPNRLVEMLRRTAGAWLAGLGFDLDGPVDDHVISNLVKALHGAGEDVPRELVDVLWYVDRLGEPDAVDELRETAREHGSSTAYVRDMTPADFVVAVWLDKPEALEWALAKQVVEKCRRVEGTSGRRGRDPTCDDAAIRALEARLSDWFDRASRYDYAKVYPFEQDGGWSFLVRHCQPLQRQDVVAEGVPKSQVVWPEVHDVIRWLRDRDEFGVHTTTAPELKEYRAAFGAVLFGDPQRFTDAPCYTLEPMLHRGRDVLHHGDIEEIHRVTLFGVRFTDPSFVGVKHKISGSTQTWAAWEAARGDAPTVPMEATFEITLRADRKHPMRVTVRPPGTLMAPKRHQQVIRRWLAQAGLLVVEGADG